VPYYMGDYRGDFYGTIRRLGGLAEPITGAIRGIGRALGIGARRAPMALPAAAGVATTTAIERIGQGAGSMVRRAGGVIARHPVVTAAAAAGAVGVAAGIGGAELTMAGHPMRGFHISRKSGRLVRNRRMRVTNPKALRRALRRAHGFAKLAMRTIHLVHPRKKGRFGGFRRKTRARV
jgi:hypothetical protein